MPELHERPDGRGPANGWRALERVALDQRPAVVAALARDLRDLELVDDAVQEAFVAALTRWPEEGVPERPAAWLTVVARRAALRRIDRDARMQLDEDALARLDDASRADPALAPEIPDARLELLFACCHRSLGLEAQVVLTLRSVGGLSTREIAAAFLVEEATMAQRLVRARNKVRDSRVPFEVPPKERLPEALDAVLAVIYLVFNEGYAAQGHAERVRTDLCREAVRLARLVVELLPEEPEALGLAALTILHDARRAARLAGGGRTVPLDEQDRSLYDRAAIAEGERLLRRATALDAPGPYQIQAAIACAHSVAPTPEATDWACIADLYEALSKVAPSPFVELNRAVALGFRDGPTVGLAHLDRLRASEPALLQHFVFHSTVAELERRAGHLERARSSYREALARAPEGAARDELELRAAELDGDVAQA